jgi:hypothetical protein
MALQFDQLNNQLKTNDSTNANAPLVLTPAGTGSVLLNGTGQNLVTYSSTLTTGWGNNSTTFTSGQTDPFGGTGAVLLNNGTANALHYFNQSFTSAAQPYTASVYVKAGTANFAGITLYTNGAFYGAGFNLTTGAFTSNILSAPTTYSSTNIGNGWWRISATITAGAGTNYHNTFISEDGTSWSYTGTSKTIYIAAPQVEVGTAMNAYTPTTSAAIYNAPVLSLSGVANIGLQSDGSLYVQPAGTGAIQAQATTSSATGGNARGQNAVDWQTHRYSAVHVASGAYSGALSGDGNQASGYAATVAGGGTNIAGTTFAFVGGGNNNQAYGYSTGVVSGQVNYANGYYNFIGGGYTNNGTSSSAVTTQSATMNGTTAVTLSGSNASIKVGQYITGTSIASDTYVSAVSGTSLTLSKVATGSTTNTLSFFTPHGVVVGGGYNQATGSYSFIGGGGDAGNSVNGNVASGDWSTVGGGIKNTASGPGSFVGGGGYYYGSIFSNTASGNAAAVVGGITNNATGPASFVSGGFGHISDATYSTVLGGSSGRTRGINGNTVIPANTGALTGSNGNAQTAILVVGKQTTDATATVLSSDGSAASNNNQVILPNNSAYYFRGEIISGVTGGGNTKGWYIEGVIKRGANAASTALVGTPTVMSSYADVGAATWSIAVTADTTNGGLAVTFTGQAATTIRTVAQIRTTEMTY